VRLLAKQHLEEKRVTTKNVEHTAQWIGHSQQQDEECGCLSDFGHTWDMPRSETVTHMDKMLVLNSVRDIEMTRSQESGTRNKKL